MSENQNNQASNQCKKGALSKFFNAAASMAVGAGFALAAKTAFCLAGAAVGAPAVATALAAAALGGAASNFATQRLAQYRARKSGQEVPEFSKKKLLAGAALGLVGGGILLAFGDTVSDAVCKFLGGGATVDVVTAPDLPAGEGIVAPPALAESAVEADPYADMSAQQIKDEAVRLFNDGRADNDKLAVELFNRAAEMGNYGAQIDQAYIEHWGLAGVPKDEFGSIEKLYNTLEEMDKAGVSHNPDFSHRPEYGRGYDLLDQWLGVQHEPLESFDPVAEGNDVTREILGRETLPTSSAPVVPPVEEIPSVHVDPEGTSQFEPSGEEEPPAMLHELTEEEAKTLNVVPGSEADPVDLPEENPVDDGMVEREIRMGAAKGGVNCKNGAAMINSREIGFICPMGGGSTVLPQIGERVLVNPPAAVVPMLGR